MIKLNHVHFIAYFIRAAPGHVREGVYWSIEGNILEFLFHPLGGCTMNGTKRKLHRHILSRCYCSHDKGQYYCGSEVTGCAILLIPCGTLVVKNMLDNLVVLSLRRKVCWCLSAKRECIWLLVLCSVWSIWQVVVLFSLWYHHIATTDSYSSFFAVSRWVSLQPVKVLS